MKIIAILFVLWTNVSFSSLNYTCISKMSGAKIYGTDATGFHKLALAFNTRAGLGLLKTKMGAINSEFNSLKGYYFLKNAVSSCTIPTSQSDGTASCDTGDGYGICTCEGTCQNFASTCKEFGCKIDVHGICSCFDDYDN